MRDALAESRALRRLFCAPGPGGRPRAEDRGRARPTSEAARRGDRALRRPAGIAWRANASASRSEVARWAAGGAGLLGESDDRRPAAWPALGAAAAQPGRAAVLVFGQAVARRQAGPGPASALAEITAASPAVRPRRRAADHPRRVRHRPAARSAPRADRPGQPWGPPPCRRSTDRHGRRWRRSGRRCLHDWLYPWGTCGETPPRSRVAAGRDGLGGRRSRGSRYSAPDDVVAAAFAARSRRHARLGAGRLQAWRTSMYLGGSAAAEPDRARGGNPDGQLQRSWPGRTGMRSCHEHHQGSALSPCTRTRVAAARPKPVRRPHVVT